ncbi:hypothetical protein KDH_37900 [Dictyobacter sp. S3.2.2.5]|uniref:Uncharacterized protein n=1 Tax=Dictyobacter halimunensis TaxID=3026934 RepID=A0ABQ6FVZ0_9CHLR|nr:hypothetical protein KDH_37900 [Dictyobacter sp. S3.2.2.5]
MNKSRTLSIAFVLFLVAGFASLPTQASAHASSYQPVKAQSDRWFSHSSSLQHPVHMAGEQDAPVTTIIGGQGTIAASSTNGGSVSCNANTHISGGGYALLDKDGKPASLKDVFVLASAPFKTNDGTEAWGVSINNTTTSPITVEVYAVCIS